MNCRRQNLDPCSPKVKPGNLKQINTQAVPISQDQPRANTTSKWLKVTNLLMLPSNSGGRLPACLPTLPGPVQQQNDRLGGKNKSTKACAALWTDMKRKSKAIHTFNASTLRQLRYWILLPSQSASLGQNTNRVRLSLCARTMSLQNVNLQWLSQKNTSGLSGGWWMQVCDMRWRRQWLFWPALRFHSLPEFWTNCSSVSFSRLIISKYYNIYIYNI